MARGLVRRESVETEMHKSEDSTKTFVYTKKKGYDVTRNPPLNKRALGKRYVYLPQLAHFTSNRSQSQHNMLIDAEGRSAESSLSSHQQASISF
ncbi:NADP-dependent malic enzyme mitochondrial [Dissostichus eleginoides]|uniref:NADP-dependent malic enzyme mitochondrial n=1 Tax=Dissostichus eleginoides TaxID=100907 RepID=A0AAD9C938_DISEL|nr:NADP-dependent malic enzyme mitochondrial [Dissostichus eleginoides]